MRKIETKAIRSPLLAVAGVILMLLLTLFIMRTPLVSWYIGKRISAFNTGQQARLVVGDVKVPGLASIMLTGITLTPASGDTLVRIDTVFASIGLLKLLAGRVALHDVKLSNCRFSLVRRDTVSNYLFLLKNTGKRSDTTVHTTDYAHAAGRLLAFVFDKIPLSLSIRNLVAEGMTNGHRVAFSVDDFSIRNHYFRSPITIAEDGGTASWIVAGRIDNHNRMAEFRLFSADSHAVTLPFLRYKWQAGISFDTIAFRVAGQEDGDSSYLISGFAVVHGLTIDHPMIARQPVVFGKAGIDYRVVVTTGGIYLDSASTVTFNRLSVNPWISYRPSPSRQVALSVHKPPFPASDLFASIPEGLFTAINGMEVRGNLSWDLDFFVDLSMPDSLRFETSLNRHGFSVISYGQTHPGRLNEPFSYTAYEHDVPVRTFIVGPENPDFRPLARISPYLQYAILTSEDGGFYQHRGFLPDAFRESMATNIKERRFARGGSTITMQLVKNVFLNRNKTVARKLEEALLVWLIENQGLCTKERMYEVYLNIIEWGPGIYGASEASRFYFNKDVSKLTLSEAIFLASIIPRPKSFRWSFTDDGHLRESLSGFYRLVSSKMVSKGWLTPSDTLNLTPDVALKGPARLMLKGEPVEEGETVGNGD